MKYFNSIFKWVFICACILAGEWAYKLMAADMLPEPGWFFVACCAFLAWICIRIYEVRTKEREP